MGELRGTLEVYLRQAAPIPLDVRVECRPGELLALVGPSGAGKSTILRCIAGLHTPREGRIACGGETWLDTARRIRVPTRRRRVGLVFQSYALFPHLTALENVMEGVVAGPRTARRRRALDLLRVVNLAGLEDRRPWELSGGQQQRVAVARALAGDPRVLLLDEPFAALDRRTREQLHAELAELRQALAIPVVLVTHDLEEAAMLADRLCIVERGATLQVGAPDEILLRPVSVEVARLVGAPHLFDGEVVAHHPEAGTTRLRWRGRELAARLDTRFPPGAPVAWFIPPAGVLLTSPHQGIAGPRDNPMSGRVTRLVALGDRISASVELDEVPGAALSLTVPRHIAARYGLAVGRPVALRLDGGSIHLMPRADGRVEVHGGMARAMETPVAPAATRSEASSSVRAWPAGAAGAVVGALGGLVGLGGAEFRLPLLVALFGLPLREAVSLNLVVSLLTVGGAAATRLLRGRELALSGALLGPAALMAVGGAVGAFAGTAWLSRLSTDGLRRAIRVVLFGLGLLLIAESAIHRVAGAVATGAAAPVMLALAVGAAIGIVSTLLGVAGGELIIPSLVFLFGADVKAAGTASLLISLPTIGAGLWRRRRAGWRIGTASLRGLVAPMGVGSVLGAVAGGLLAGAASAGWLKIMLGAILVLSALRVFEPARRA